MGDSFFMTMIRITIDIRVDVHIHFDNPSTDSPSEPQQPTSPQRIESIPVEDSFTHYAEQQIALAQSQGSFSRSRNYRTALQSFLRFREDKDLPLSALTGTLLAEFERWLKSRNIRMGTISCYLRSLRAIYNKAVDEERVTNRTPFAKCYTGSPRTEKRSIPAEDLRKLQALTAEQVGCFQWVRDIFLFCLMSCGMPFVDVAFLRKSQISDDGILTYHRRKTHQPIRFRLLPEAQEIIRRYASDHTEYVFPILTQTDPEQAYRQYKEKLSYYNKCLKELGKRAGVTRPLTSYVSRHSWASLAYEANTELAVISKGLGHTSPNTTLIYVKGINDTRLDDANRKIMEQVLMKKK